MKRSKSYVQDIHTMADKSQERNDSLEQWGDILINLYSNRVCKVPKIDDIDQLCRDINEDPIIKGLYVTDINALNGKYLWEVVVTSLSCLSSLANHTAGFVTKQEEPEVIFSKVDKSHLSKVLPQKIFLKVLYFRNTFLISQNSFYKVLKLFQPW